MEGSKKYREKLVSAREYFADQFCSGREEDVNIVEGSR